MFFNKYIIPTKANSESVFLVLPDRPEMLIVKSQMMEKGKVVCNQRGVGVGVHRLVNIA